MCLMCLCASCVQHRNASQVAWDQGITASASYGKLPNNGSTGDNAIMCGYSQDTFGVYVNYLPCYISAAAAFNGSATNHSGDT